jgi:sugar/nucleoside kinase (ribokinase family)
MVSSPLLSYVVVGQLRRDYILTAAGKSYLDVPGGNLLYSATGVGIWDNGIGLVGRAGENYPQEWLEDFERKQFDTRGIHIVPQPIDQRSFFAYTDLETCHTENPVLHFARLGIPYPKSLIGYTQINPGLENRLQPSPLTIRSSDIPGDYRDATAAHLCPLDFLTHSLLPSTLRQGNISTITLSPSANYMNPTFWEEIPGLLKGISALLVNEQKALSLFQGRSSDLWEIAEALAGMGCDLVVIYQGMGGQMLYDRLSHNRWIVPAYPSRISDPTGAEDAFCGGFLTGYHSTYLPVEGVLAGNVSASLVMEGSGPFYALDALPGLAEARKNALQSMVRKI